MQIKSIWEVKEIPTREQESESGKGRQPIKCALSSKSSLRLTGARLLGNSGSQCKNVFESCSPLGQEIEIFILQCLLVEA